MVCVALSATAMESRSIIRAARRRSAPRLSTGGPNSSLCTRVMFSTTLRSPSMAYFLRSSVIRQMPARMAEPGPRTRTVFPPMRMSPGPGDPRRR